MNLAISEIDAAIIVAYLLGVVAFGIWMGRGQRDATGYLLGGRDLPWWVLLFSIVATETSTVTFLSIPGKAFAPDDGSLVFLQLTIGFILGRFVIVWLFLPHYFRGELFTAYEVLHRRFGGATKQTASLLFLVARNLADGLRLYLTALVLYHVLRLDLSICVVAIGVTTILYTFVGGMKAVAWNDCIQFVVYVGGAVLAGCVILASLPGGWGSFSDFAVTHHKLRLFDFSLDLTRTYTFWSGLVGGLFLTLATHGTDQLMVQRYLAARSRKEAGRALALSGFVVCGQFALFLLIGVGLACFYHFHPTTTKLAGDEVFAAFIVGHLPIGVVGITLAAVFSAAMSTLSSSLNSSATAAANDFYLPLRKEKPSAKRMLWVSRGLTVLFGLVQIGIAIGAGLVGMEKSVVDQVLGIAGFTAGPILGVFFLGVLTRRATQRNALLGLLAGLAVLTGVKFGTDLAWPWFALVGSSVTFAVGLLASLSPPDSKVPPNHDR